MEELDKRIVSMKMEMKEHELMSLHDGYYVDGELITFSKTKLFDDRISVYLPDSFVDMPIQVIQLKYPSLMRPQIIRTNLMTNVNFTFSLLENPEFITSADSIHGFRNVLSRTNPAICASDCKNELTSNNIELSYFDFISFGLDEHIYNFSCMMSASEKLLQGSFNCLEREMRDWKILAKDVFLNLEILK